MDVGDQNSVDAAIARIVAEAGRLDVVVHNAGHMSFGPAEAFTAEQLAELYDVNALGTQRVNRAALPHLREQGRGLLLWVSSSSVRGNWAPYLAPYFAAKAGMEQLAISYAAELARFGIETSILVPGAFTQGTEHFAHSMNPGDADRARVYDEGPTARLGDRILEAHEALEPADADPGEVAAAIVRIVDAPSGRRPFRVTIDPSQDGSEIVAAVQDRFRRDTLRRVGLDDLLVPLVSEAHAAGAGR
jgi:NAD(P)-dependent dehydrogenase (short-subunit alcohol dehydrogenase family)